MEEIQEIDLWVAQRRKNWPSNKRIQDKEEKQQVKEDIGLEQPKLSKIEIKLRRKLKIINMQMGSEKKGKKRDMK